MKKIAAIIIILIIIAVGGILIATNNNNKDNNKKSSDMAGMKMNQSASSGSASSNQNTNQNASPVATNTVTIANFAFSPADISIKAGTQVTWTNNDSTTHTVDETDGQSGPASGMLNPGASYSFTFDKPGTYHYHCSIHPEMTGTVTVTQ